MEYIKLNELCEINIGKTPSRSNSDYWGIGNKWLSIADLKSKYVSEAKEEITDLAVEEAKMRVVPKNTVVMSFKLSIGKLAILQEDMYTNEAIANFRIKNKELITPEYLYYALKTLNFDNSTDRAVMGATLNKSKLNDIKIPYCKIDIQKKIVEVLDKSQSLIDKKKEQIDLLDDLVKSRFVEMFGYLTKNKNKYNSKKIGILCEEILGGGTPSKSHPEYYGGEIPWVTPKDMKCKEINKAQIYINENGIKNSSAKIIKKNSVLMVIRSGILKKTLPIAINRVEVAINQDMKAFILGNSVNIQYFYFAIKNIERELLSNVRGVTADNIEFSIIKNYELPIPPIELQNEFAEFVTQTDSIRSKMEASLSELEDNFNSLIQKALKGELFN